MADTESSVNERLPFSPKELEIHWNVDCNATLKALKNFPLKSAVNQQLTSFVDKSLDSLKKCALIYNTKNTGRYSACINYQALHQQLETVQSSQETTENPFNANKFDSSLASLLKLLKTNHCPKTRN